MDNSTETPEQRHIRRSHNGIAIRIHHFSILVPQNTANKPQRTIGRNTTRGNSHHTQMVKTTDSHSTTTTPTPTQYTVSEQADVTSAPKYGKRADRFVVSREGRTAILGGGRGRDNVP